jgi:hypothetical protein
MEKIKQTEQTNPVIPVRPEQSNLDSFELSYDDSASMPYQLTMNGSPVPLDNVSSMFVKIESGKRPVIHIDRVYS